MKRSRLTPIKLDNIASIAPPITTPDPPSTITIGGGALPSAQISNIVAALPKDPSSAYPSRPLSSIRQIIIHHTAVSNKVGPQRIARIQVKGGKAGITYHYFIAWDGTIYQTNEQTTLSEHTQGRNQDSIAIAFAGNFTSGIPNQAQLKAGGNLGAALMLQLNIPLNNIKGATELINTQSPGKQWLQGQKWKIRLLNEINQARGSAPVISPPVAPPEAAAPQAEDEGQIALLKAQIAQLAAQLAQTQSAYQDAAQQISALNQRAAQQEAQLAQTQSAYNTARQQTGALNQRIVQLETELAQAKAAAGAGIGSGEGAALKERIAMLELQLSIAEETAAASGGPPPPSTIGAGISAPPIDNLVDTLPHHPSNRYPSRSVSAIRTIVVHHSAVPASISAQRIAQFNVSKNNWPGIGFHYFITAEGVIQQSNELSAISYHAGGDNPTSLGVAFAGDFDDERPTQSQIEAGGHLIAWLLYNFSLSLSAVKAHKDLADTPCPGAQWESGSAWKNSLFQAIQNHKPGISAGPVASGDKGIYHYMLFRQKDDLAAASNYISKFQPTIGFSVEDAMSAQYVSIVDPRQKVSSQDEARLRGDGSQVERIAGNTSQAIKALLDNMSLTNRRFLTLTG